jgi:hypothetical protein
MMKKETSGRPLRQDFVKPFLSFSCFRTFGQARRMDMVQWCVAFGAHALAAHACGMWDYCAAQAHLRNCLQVACTTLRLVVACTHDHVFVCTFVRSGLPLQDEASAGTGLRRDLPESMGAESSTRQALLLPRVATCMRFCLCKVTRTSTSRQLP